QTITSNSSLSSRRVRMAAMTTLEIVPAALYAGKQAEMLGLAGAGSPAGARATAGAVRGGSARPEPSPDMGGSLARGDAFCHSGAQSRYPRARSFSRTAGSIAPLGRAG